MKWMIAEKDKMNKVDNAMESRLDNTTKKRTHNKVGNFEVKQMENIVADCADSSYDIQVDKGVNNMT